MNPKERIEDLVKTLNQANVEYYLNDNPTLTDNEYDSLLMELFRLEDEYPEYKLPESPTQNVGTKILDQFEKITHGTPMFSLADVFNEEEIEAFVTRVEKEIDNPTIGLLICKSKDNVLARYALESTSQPIGISEYELEKFYPTKLEGTIPTIEELEKQL